MSLTFTPILPQPPNCSNSGQFGYAALTILPTINMNKKNILARGILDLGATSHFLVSKAPINDKKEAEISLMLRLPDGQTVSLSHDGELNLHYLLPAARKAHPLVLFVKLCHGGCDMRISDVNYKIWIRGRKIVTCRKCMCTGLWMMPLTSDAA